MTEGDRLRLSGTFLTEVSSAVAEPVPVADRPVTTKAADASDVVGQQSLPIIAVRLVNGSAATDFIGSTVAGSVGPTATDSVAGIAAIA